MYGVIGWPIAHSRSPVLHNAGFERTGHDGVLLPMPIAPSWEAFKATLLDLLACEALDFLGAAITIPHKEHLVRLAREDTSRTWHIDPFAERIGAANTITIGTDGAVTVTNTDAPAIVEALESMFGDGATHPLRGRRIAILGAGGAARSAAIGLLDAGAHVVVHNRTRERADQLVADAMQHVAHATSHAGTITRETWASMNGSGFDAVVNCTPIGMVSGPDPSGESFPSAMLDGLGADAVVFDTVYVPRDTPMLAAARERDLRTLDGVELFVRQASRQCELWTGESAPLALFRTVCEESLATSTP